jgi:hypothetical protein
MLASQIPAKFNIPFANSAGVGYIRTIPQSSQVSITPGAASLTDGFPPLTFTAIGAGGVPMSGQDMNGILNEITANQQWLQAGGMAVYDSAFSSAIGGYPNGAVLRMANNNGIWVSMVDNNTTNPDASGAGWIPLSTASGSYLSLSVAGSTNVTLTTVQAATSIINLTGALTANINLIVPTATGEWLIANNTTGAFTVTVKTASGTGVAATQGTANQYYCDGTNVYYEGLSQSQADARYAASIPNFTASTTSNLISASLGTGKVDFRNAVLATGTPVEYNVTSTLTLAMNSTAASLGATSGVIADLIYALVYNAGIPQLAVCNLSGGLQIDEANLITTTAIGSGSTSAATWYSTTAIATASQYKIVGRVRATWTSGTGWSTPVLVQPIGVGMVSNAPMGGISQVVANNNTVSATVSFTAPGAGILIAIGSKNNSVQDSTNHTSTLTINGITQMGDTTQSSTTHFGFATTSGGAVSASYSTASGYAFSCNVALYWIPTL